MSPHPQVAFVLFVASAMAAMAGPNDPPLQRTIVTLQIDGMI